ncbi:lipase 1-like [Cydia amplana]|uniref:lipase 1-like n=1 Tax=Cydia amplana TaxID=1869771 RepID=UPI002FE5203D
MPEDGRLDFMELSIKYGHKAEEHRVVTEDGYILTLFRLPGEKPPVLLLHGLIGTADTYILRGNNSLGITLANHGYDVWAGNTRGNKYAMQHTKLDPNTDASFWDYSFHEHGYYDLPAMTDYILNVTGEQSLQSIGHSEGTTDHFILGSLRPEYNEKYKILIALSPSAYLSNLVPPMSIFIKLAPIINAILRSLNIEYVFHYKGLERILLEAICNPGSVSYSLCTEFVFLIGGYDLQRLESEFLAVVFGHFPSSLSRKALLHCAQVAQSKRFPLFDYGLEDNLKRYGSTAPPDYNLRNVTMRTALLVGKNDPINGVRDVERLRFVLPNVVHYHLMKPRRWNHFDFVWSNDLPKTLFPHILTLLERFS